MGCGSCGVGGVGGCQSKGGCSSGGCNRMNVHNWLSDVPVLDNENTCKVIEVSYNNGSRKDFIKNTTTLLLEKGDMIAVEGVSGFDVGMVNLTGELVRLQMKKRNVDENNPEMKKVLRIATDSDLQKMKDSKAKEAEMLIKSRAIARYLKLEMKMAEVEIQADGRKATYFYIADERVDFRELIKQYASEFKVKVEMRQIGARQEAGKVGGIGSCGRELCCSSWLTDFKSVNTNAARYQNLSINQTKLSGQCGRLKCCLNYELDTYMDALQFFPNDADMIEVAKGRAFLSKKDIFRNLMWYTLPDSNKPYALTIERVQKIKELNRQGIRPDDLEPVEVVGKKQVEVEPVYADVVGQISLRSLEKTSRKRRENEGRGNRAQGGGGQNRGQQGPQRGGGNNPSRGGGAPGQRPDVRGPREQRQPRNEQGGQQGANAPQGQNRPAQQKGQQNRPPQGGGNRPNNNRNRSEFKPGDNAPKDGQ